MNLQTNSSDSQARKISVDDIDFDFKPINSGLGFHGKPTTEIKATFKDNTHSAPLKTQNLASLNLRADRVSDNSFQTNQIYQNDLSLFYNREKNQQIQTTSVPKDTVLRLAAKPLRVVAYFLDLVFILSALSLVLTIMARLAQVDLKDAWASYPNEIIPLVLTLFTGFFLMYFSIFEKTNQSTLGKYFLGIRVTNMNNKGVSLNFLFLRSLISLLNFISLGLFSYFDLQSKITQTKVVRVD